MASKDQASISVASTARTIHLDGPAWSTTPIPDISSAIYKDSARLAIAASSLDQQQPTGQKFDSNIIAAVSCGIVSFIAVIVWAFLYIRHLRLQRKRSSERQQWPSRTPMLGSEVGDDMLKGRKRERNVDVANCTTERIQQSLRPESRRNGGGGIGEMHSRSSRDHAAPSVASSSQGFITIGLSRPGNSRADHTANASHLSGGNIAHGQEPFYNHLTKPQDSLTELYPDSPTLPYFPAILRRISSKRKPRSLYGRRNYRPPSSIYTLPAQDSAEVPFESFSRDAGPPKVPLQTSSTTLLNEGRHFGMGSVSAQHESRHNRPRRAQTHISKSDISHATVAGGHENEYIALIDPLAKIYRNPDGADDVANGTTESTRPRLMLTTTGLGTHVNTKSSPARAMEAAWSGITPSAGPISSRQSKIGLRNSMHNGRPVPSLQDATQSWSAVPLSAK